MLLRIVNRATAAVTIVLLAAMTVLVAVEVVLRYGFGKSLYVTEELSRYLMVWVVFLASGLAIRDNAHISIEILANRFRGRARAWYDLAALLFFLAFLAFLVLEGVVALTFQMEQIIPSLNVAMFWFYLAIPVGGALMILNLLPRAWRDVRIILGREQPAEAAAGKPAAAPGTSS
ncbi:MAG: TRAP transporter small permease [Candidatus Methylomirabilales bacterium]